MQVVQRQGLRRVATIQYQANTTVRENIPVSGKVRNFFLVLSGVQTHSNVTSVFAQGQGPGGVVQGITAYLDRDVVYKQGRFSDFKDRQAQFSKAPNTVAIGVTAAAHTFKDYARLNCVTPGGRFPEDTALDMDQWSRLDFEIQWGDETSICTATATSFTTNPTIEVYAEVINTERAPNGLYRETAFDSDALGTSANTGLELELVTGANRNLHHLMLIAEDNAANVGRTKVSTVLNSIRLQQTAAFGQSNLFGLISGAALQEEYDSRFSRVDGIQTGVYPVLFQPRYDGLSTFNVFTEPLDDLRFIIDHAAFSTAGYIRVLEGIVEPL